MWPAALVPKHLTFPGEKSVLQTFPLLPAAPACTTSQHPLPLRISLVFIPSANFTSSSLSCRSQIRGCCSVVIGSFSSYLLFAFFFLPLSLSLHFTTHASAPFASTSWVFCFLKVTRLAHVTGHKSRGLCSRAGEMKEDNTHNMPCTSLSCIDQKCTAWPNAATVLHWKKRIWKYSSKQKKCIKLLLATLQKSHILSKKKISHGPAAVFITFSLVYQNANTQVAKEILCYRFDYSMESTFSVCFFILLLFSQFADPLLVFPRLDLKANWRAGGN